MFSSTGVTALVTGISGALAATSAKMLRSMGGDEVLSGVQTKSSLKSVEARGVGGADDVRVRVCVRAGDTEYKLFPVCGCSMADEILSARVSSHHPGFL